MGYQDVERRFCSPIATQPNFLKFILQSSAECCQRPHESVFIYKRWGYVTFKDRWPSMVFRWVIVTLSFWIGKEFYAFVLKNHFGFTKETSELRCNDKIINSVFTFIFKTVLQIHHEIKQGSKYTLVAKCCSNSSFLLLVFQENLFFHWI